MATAKQKELQARAAQRAATREQLLAKKPRTAQVEVLLDDSLVIEHDRILDRLGSLGGNGTDADRRKELESRLDKIRRSIEEQTVVLTFRSIGAKRYDELVDQHPATKEQDKEAQDNFGVKAPYNADTFPPALIAASLAEPELNEEEVLQLWESWNREERTDLFAAAMDVNSRAARVGDLGKGSG